MRDCNGSEIPAVLVCVLLEADDHAADITADDAGRFAGGHDPAHPILLFGLKTILVHTPNDCGLPITGLNEEIDLSVQLGGRKSVHEVNLEPVEEHNEQSFGSARPGGTS